MVSYNVTKANLEATKKVRITYIQQLQFSKRYARANSFLRNAFEGKKMFSSCNVYFEEAFFLKGVFLPPPPPLPLRPPCRSIAFPTAAEPQFSLFAV